MRELPSFHIVETSLSSLKTPKLAKPKKTERKRRELRGRDLLLKKGHSIE